MKQFIFIFSVIFLSQTFCHATGHNIKDSIKVEYEVYGNDTVFYKKYSTSRETTTCGLKKYEDELFAKYHKIHNNGFERNHVYKEFEYDKNIPDFYKYITKKILEGYGKERCIEMLRKYNGKLPKMIIYISIDVEGNVFDLVFIYHQSFTEYMTANDIIRNTRILENSAPVPFFREYKELGLKILPPLRPPLLKQFIEEYIEQE